MIGWSFIELKSHSQIDKSWRAAADPRPGFIEQPPDIGHRPKQLHGLIRQWQKTFPLLEATGAVVLCIDDHREGSDLTPSSTVEGVSHVRVVDLNIGASKSDICAIRVVTISERAGGTRAGNRGLVHKQLWKTLSLPAVRRLIAKEQHQVRASGPSPATCERWPAYH
jgi:hypothetical protein